MRQLSLFIGVLLMLSVSGKTQPSIRLDYFSKVPANFKNCGALYTYDTIALEKKKYILLTDYQNLGMITINGKEVKLLLSDTKTIHKTNVITYKGGGYTVIVTSTTTAQKGRWDIETGTLQILTGVQKQTVKIHGQSGCDESKQEGN